MGLISTGSNDVRIGVDSQFKTTNTGRASVRLSSKASYTDGLFIAKFNHFPKPVCGSWPAFWMVGPNWPAGGEIDIYEVCNPDSPSFPRDRCEVGDLGEGGP